MPNSPKLIIGFITYGSSTARYLPFFLESLKKQTFFDHRILAFDNSGSKDNENKVFIDSNYPDIEILRADGNIGFARSFNILINKSVLAGSRFFLALNPDTILEPDFVDKALNAIEQDEKIGAIAPKILKWDFNENKKTNIIDSTGIFITKEHRFSDLNQGETDDGMKFQNKKEVFGFTGAAVLFRISALEDIAYKNKNDPEFFDELMFMYKEDADLSYRLRLAGWKIFYEPTAVIYHDRAASPLGDSNLEIAKNRKNKSPQIKKWSFLNHWILILKYLRLPFSTGVIIATCWYQFKSLAYAVIFEPYLLKEFFKLRKIWKEIGKKREDMAIRIDLQEIEKFMR
jgi:GT2 family glycosyltransferase